MNVSNTAQDQVAAEGGLEMEKRCAYQCQVPSEFLRAKITGTNDFADFHRKIIRSRGPKGIEKVIEKCPSAGTSTRFNFPDYRPEPASAVAGDSLGERVANKHRLNAVQHKPRYDKMPLRHVNVEFGAEKGQGSW